MNAFIVTENLSFQREKKMALKACKKCGVEKCTVDFRFCTKLSCYLDVCKACADNRRTSEREKVRKNSLSYTESWGAFRINR